MRIVRMILAVWLLGAAVQAQQTSPPLPPAAPPPQPAPGAPVGPVPAPTSPPAVASGARQFAAPAGMIFNAVRPDRVADFEMVIGYLKDALAASTDPTVRAQAAGWQFLRATEPGPNATVLYVFVIDPVVEGADYGLGRILSDAYPDRVQEMWKLYTGSLANQSLLNLTPVTPPPALPLPPAGP